MTKTATNYLLYDVASGIVYGTGYTPDGTIPAGAIACTAAHKTAWQSWKVANPTGTPTLVATIPPTPSLAAQAAAASVSGLTITLTGTVTLAATLFPTDTMMQSAISKMNTMAARGVLPTGATSYPMVDATGTWHKFNTAVYQAIAGAIASYVAACDLIAAGNPLGVTALPAANVTITV